MRDHIRLCGILHMVYSGLGIVIGLMVVLWMGVAASGAFGIGASESGDARIGFAIAFVVGFVLIAVNVPGFIGGWGLVKFRPWARILMIVISAFDLLSIPLGTALGVYSLWVLLKPETEQILRSGGMYVPAPAPVYPPPAAT